MTTRIPNTLLLGPDASCFSVAVPQEDRTGEVAIFDSSKALGVSLEATKVPIAAVCVPSQELSLEVLDALLRRLVSESSVRPLLFVRESGEHRMRELDGVAHLSLDARDPALATVSATLADRARTESFSRAMRLLYGRWGSLPNAMLRIALGSGLRNGTLKQILSVLDQSRWDLRRELASIGILRGDRVLCAGLLTVARELSLRFDWTAGDVARYCGYADSRPLKSACIRSAVGDVASWRDELRECDSRAVADDRFLARLDWYVLRDSDGRVDGARSQGPAGFLDAMSE
jgi:hypothetical protein